MVTKMICFGRQGSPSSFPHFSSQVSDLRDLLSASGTIHLRTAFLLGVLSLSGGRVTSHSFELLHLGIFLKRAIRLVLGNVPSVGTAHTWHRGRHASVPGSFAARQCMLQAKHSPDAARKLLKLSHTRFAEVGRPSRR